MIESETIDIYKLKVAFGLGWAYCKVVYFPEISDEYATIVYVFDFFDDGEVDDVGFFDSLPLFMNPLPISKPPTVRGKYAWKKIGTLTKSENDQIPFYKMPLGHRLVLGTIEEYNSSEWYTYEDIRHKMGPFACDKVRHLEDLFVRSTVTIEQRIAMQLLRYQGVDIPDVLSKNEAGYNRPDYNAQKFIPLYRKIPETIRGKPLIKGLVPDEYLNFDWDSIKD